jgi:hypothetical protein
MLILREFTVMCQEFRVCDFCGQGCALLVPAGREALELSLHRINSRDIGRDEMIAAALGCDPLKVTIGGNRPPRHQRVEDGKAPKTTKPGTGHPEM